MNKILLDYFYLLEPIHKIHFNVRYPVHDRMGALTYKLRVGTHGSWVPMGTQGYYPKKYIRVWVGLGLCLISMGIFGLGTQKGF